MRTLRHRFISWYYQFKLKRIIDHTTQLKKTNSNEWIFYIRIEIDKLKLPAFKVIVNPIIDEKVKGLIVHGKEIHSKNAILYFHDGGYFIGSPELYIRHAYNLSVACNAPVYVINYRKTPEYSYRETLADAQQAYEFLLRSGIEPKNISIGGYSAGGELTLALFFLLREKNIPLPAACFCISPWVDLLFSSG